MKNEFNFDTHLQSLGFKKHSEKGCYDCFDKGNLRVIVEEGAYRILEDSSEIWAETIPDSLKWFNNQVEEMELVKERKILSCDKPPTNAQIKEKIIQIKENTQSAKIDYENNLVIIEQ